MWSVFVGIGRDVGHLVNQKELEKLVVRLEGLVQMNRMDEQTGLLVGSAKPCILCL